MNNTKRPYRLAVALNELEVFEDWLELALRLTPQDGEIYLYGLISVAPGKSLSEGATAARIWRDTLDAYIHEHPDLHNHVTVYVDHRPMARVLKDIRELQPNLLLVQWRRPSLVIAGVKVDDILEHARCDVVLVRGALWKAQGPVLLSLRGGPHVSLGLRVAKALAGQDSITLFHAADRQPIPNLRTLMQSDSQIERTVTARRGITEGILRESFGHKAIVLGATFHEPTSKGSVSGPVIQHLLQQTDSTLVLVRKHQPEAIAIHPPEWTLIRKETLSTQVDRWFAENTFHHNEFADLRMLLALKEKQGVTISVGLPALNEEDTVGNVIQTLKAALMDDIPLVDEIVLIDSDSTDQTVAIAESHGVPVYCHSQILPEEGSFPGKGEALWKSLHVLNGDIIAWVDTDITNISPHFVYGLLGPLLKYPRVQYVKGFYRRPIEVGGELQAFGGGRVTELVARPLLNLFYPELSGVIQPLSGEYAGRRAALEQVPFFSGYGVETGLLIDILERYGLEGIAQSDLEVRVHHNQELVSLSKMSFAIMQVFIARLESRYGVQLLDQANRTLKLVVHEPERFALDITAISDIERLPMAAVPGCGERSVVHEVV